MAVTTSPLWKTHWTLWRSTFATLWRNRRPLVGLTVLLWVPWRIAVPLIDRWVRFHDHTGFPLDWVVDAFYEPLYAGVVLSLCASTGATSSGRTLLRGIWLMPRLLLIDLKIAVWGLAAPYLMLHLGSALLLTWWQTQLAGNLVVGATVASMSWMLVVLLRYLIAPAVLVAERSAMDARDSGADPSGSSWGWSGSGGISTGWSLWAARRLVRGRISHALLVLLVGQGTVLTIMAVLPPAENLLTQVIGGVAMLATALWWGILWEFATWCIAGHGTERDA